MDISLTTALQVALLLAAAGVAAGTFAGFLGAVSGWLDYASHFRPHLAVAALLAAAGAWLLFDGQRGVPLVSALAIVGIVNIAAVVVEGRFRAPAITVDDTTTMKIASVNLLYRNIQYGRAQRWIRREQPDVLILTEVTDRWADVIETLSDLYPYRAVRRTRWVAMIARRPWASFEVVAGPRPGQGVLVARFDIGGAPLTVIGAHPASPVNLRSVQGRDVELDIIGRLAREAAGPVAALGDFNATPWSAPMRRLVRSSPLRYADLHATTWPTFVPRWLGIKIDHIMIGNGCAVVDYKAGPGIGSDHRPVMATIQWLRPRPSP